MGDTTNISWADMTFNPWIGCTRISPACDGCYAAHLMESRMGRAVWGGPGKGNGTRARTSEANWKKPLAWNAAAEKDGTRPFVFCSSLADVFDNVVPPAWRQDLFELIRATPHLVWLLLTKRPQNISKMAETAGGLPPNAAIGSTVEDQQRADINVPALLQASIDLWSTKTRPLFLFLSCEPMIGPIDLTAFKEYPGSEYHVDALRGKVWMDPDKNNVPGTSHVKDGRDYVGLHHSVQWVIAGGETDQGEHKARPTHPDWLRNLRDQCAEAGVAFHFKQWGEWTPGENVPHTVRGRRPSAHYWAGEWDIGSTNMRDPEDGWMDEPDTYRIGKKLTGRKLDGVEHLARPDVQSKAGVA
ncbi:phage Gp37/Gp68 family protein [Rhizobium sp. CG4]|uniref:DUF5131 family protein n=1 Tax=Rhizobium sp. CG4 TaxID=2726075 RepID=UPI0020336C78|nr:DUF5131 family protein [Rhizobium sp. CG4]MCM2455331.1 phage Gp37/Gp68 family protein [Rhizobium sp. CG4]